MSKRSKRIDPNQRTFDFTFEERVEAHLQEKAELLDTLHNTTPAKSIESYDEACIELAAVIKKAVKASGMSREQVADGVNKYFGWATAEEFEALKKSGAKVNNTKHLSIFMFNHYLSKPAEYTIPAPYLYAIHHVTGSLEPCRSFAESEDGDVITKEEKDELMLGKMEKAVYEMQRLKRELKGRR